MEVKNEISEFDFADKNKDERIRQLLLLKRTVENYKGNYTSQYNDGHNSSQNNTNGYQKTLSTNIGKSMTENNNRNRQSGFLNAFMLGIISFVFEALFLAIAIFIYK